jgi:hypothetical protein
MSKRARSVSGPRILIWIVPELAPMVHAFAARLCKLSASVERQRALYYDVLDGLADSATLPVPHRRFTPDTLPRQFGMCTARHIPRLLAEIIQALEAIRVLAGRRALAPTTFPRHCAILALHDYFRHSAVDYERWLDGHYGTFKQDMVDVYVAPETIAAPAPAPAPNIDITAEAEAPWSPLHDTTQSPTRHYNSAHEEARDIDAFGLTGFYYFESVS